jgi:hypothetical protein
VVYHYYYSGTFLCTCLLGSFLRAFIVMPVPVLMMPATDGLDAQATPTVDLVDGSAAKRREQGLNGFNNRLTRQDCSARQLAEPLNWGAEYMLALEGGEKLSRDTSDRSKLSNMSFSGALGISFGDSFGGPSGGSFGRLFGRSFGGSSGEMSQTEHQRAMIAISDDLGKPAQPFRQLPITGASPLMTRTGPALALSGSAVWAAVWATTNGSVSAPSTTTASGGNGPSNVQPGTAQQRSTSRLVGLALEAAVAAATLSAATALSERKGRAWPLSTVAADAAVAHVAAAAAASAASRLIHAEADESHIAKGGAPSRSSSITRRAWSSEEDQMILSCVDRMGPRWREIAPLLPGRSDDSVRNRWKRLTKETDAHRDADEMTATGSSSSLPGTYDTLASSASHNVPDDDVYRGARVGSKRQGSESAAAASKRPNHSAKSKSNAKPVSTDDGQGNGSRVAWTSGEDQMIVSAVKELGPRWCAVAARLPMRTDQAVRNRWNRLQQRARVQARTMLDSFQPQRGGAEAAVE